MLAVLYFENKLLCHQNNKNNGQRFGHNRIKSRELENRS